MDRRECVVTSRRPASLQGPARLSLSLRRSLVARARARRDLARQEHADTLSSRITHCKVWFLVAFLGYNFASLKRYFFFDCKKNILGCPAGKGEEGLSIQSGLTTNRKIVKSLQINTTIEVLAIITMLFLLIRKTLKKPRDIPRFHSLQTSPTSQLQCCCRTLLIHQQ